MSSERSILVIDDDPDVCAAARYALQGAGFQIELLTSLDALESSLDTTLFDSILLDMNFAAGENTGRAGLDGLARITAVDPEVAIVLMTAYGGVVLAVEALKRGAVDFVLKPWKNARLIDAMSHAAAMTASRREVGRATLDHLERDAIRQALARHAGNISRAAEALGVTRPALYRKIEKHGL